MTPPGLRPSVLAARERLAAGRTRLLERHQRGSPGVQSGQALTDLLDGVVLDLHHAAIADLQAEGVPGLDDQVTLVAHGGYGRRDVAPYSDVDLMFLHTPQAESSVRKLAERMMRDVFDSGLILGHSVRTIDQACQMVLQEATICTALLESRRLFGNEPLFEEYQLRLAQQVRRRVGPLVEMICQARDEERRQYGETVYLLEPNIKRSRGALRDIQLIRWIGAVAYGSPDLDGLQLRGELSKTDQGQLRAAHEFLLRTRHEMHFHAGKSNDQLDRSEQVRLSRLFGFAGEAGLLPVEEFMREYFLHTDAVSHIAARFIANAQPGSRLRTWTHWLFSRRQDHDFLVGPRELTATRRGLQRLRGNLSEILRLADLANQSDKRIAHGTAEAIREAAAEIPDEITSTAAERFLSLLRHPLRLGWMLRLLHEVRVLEKIIPAFVRARSLLQFNEYHKYTVDEHSLRAVEGAAALATRTGALGDVYRRIKNKSLLHLALLIHDLGKGRPEDHSEVGREIAAETARRLRMTPHDTESLCFLVHKHLMMSHLAFRRDTSDEQIVVRFAVDVGSPENLDMLFVLTCCDMQAVGPGVLTEWKVDVLADLHRRARRHLAGGGDDTAERARQEVREALHRRAAGADAWFERQVAALPTAYLAARSPEIVLEELDELHEMPTGQVRARGKYLPETQTVEYTIATDETVARGIFHRLTGALTGKGLEIISAEINTLADGLVLDRFLVCDPDYAEAPPASRIDEVTQALERSLLNASDAAPSFRRVWQSGSNRVGFTTLPTQVRTDNTTSERYTIIDIFAADCRGLLYTITRRLFELSLSVAVAKISTHLDQVVDVFYVTDQGGNKIEDPQQLEAIRQSLTTEIERLEREAGHVSATG